MVAPNSYFARKSCACGIDVFSVDITAAAAAEQPYVTDSAVLALFNPAGSGKRLRLKGVQTSNKGQGAANTTFDSSRIAAPTYAQIVSGGGVSTSNYIDLTATPLDSASPAFPGFSATSIQFVAAGTVFMRHCGYTGLIGLRPVAATGSNSMLVARNLFNGRVIRAKDSAMQSITLRAGEALRIGYACQCAVAVIQLFAECRVGSDRYFLQALIPPSQDRGGNSMMWYIVNPTGSGAVIEVLSYGFLEVAGGGYATGFALELISGIGDIAGMTQTESAVPLDSSAPASAAVLKSNCVTKKRGSEVGALVCRPTLRGTQVNTSMRGPGTTWNAAAGMMNGSSRDIAMLDNTQGNEIVLNEGQGAAFLQRAEGFGEFDINFHWSEESVGGGSGVSRGRVTNA